MGDDGEVVKKAVYCHSDSDRNGSHQHNGFLGKLFFRRPDKGVDAEQNGSSVDNMGSQKRLPQIQHLGKMQYCLYGDVQKRRTDNQLIDPAVFEQDFVHEKEQQWDWDGGKDDKINEIPRIRIIYHVKVKKIFRKVVYSENDGKPADRLGGFAALTVHEDTAGDQQDDSDEQGGDDDQVMGQIFKKCAAKHRNAVSEHHIG